MRFPYVIARQSSAESRHPFLQFVVVAPPVVRVPVCVIHMTPALLGGWNFGRVDYQTAEDWPGMSGEAIVAWKWAQLDECAREPTEAERTLVLRWLERGLAAGKDGAA